ncbi:MAG: hypothetical protein KF861_07795 [Planctomycetaceae bacterium]|nr:hypothetical protein [Planctomycetaceae bacterium]
MVNVRSLWLLPVFFLLVSLPGCSGGGTADPSAGESEHAASDDHPASSAAKPGDASLSGGAAQGTTSAASKPATPSRTSLEGHWALALHGFGGNILGMLLEITPSETGYEVKTIGESPLNWTLQSSEIVGNDVHLTLGDPSGRVLDFRGTFADGQVRGSADSGNVGIDLASLVPAKAESLDQSNFREPDPDFDKISSIKQDENMIPNLLKLSQQLKSSPLGFQLNHQILTSLQRQPQQNVDPAMLFDNYLAAAAVWGNRVVDFANMEIAFTLALRSASPDVAMKHLEAAEKGFGDTASPPVKDRLQTTRGLLLVDAEATRDQGIALLREVHDENLFNFLATAKLADVFERQGKLDEAVEMFAELVAIPAIPGDHAKVAELWMKSGRNLRDLDDHLDGIFQRVVRRLPEGSEPVGDALENQQVVLGELFTGASCPPCVAGDIATSALQTIYPQSRFVMLRYHQHIPGPDPMTVPDGEQRRDYYAIQGTPMIYLNGIRGPAIGGDQFIHSGLVLGTLQQAISPLLNQTSELSIDLTADMSADGKSIHVTARVDGTDEYPENWRLRLCLAEESIHYPAPNGIRVHEMVVRFMPGGSNGVIAKDGALSYEADIAVDDILANIEEGIQLANARSGGSLPLLNVKISQLQLVGFVQDDDTQEILQTASCPVNGMADAGSDDPTAPKKATSTTTEPEPAATQE